MPEVNSRKYLNWLLPGYGMAGRRFPVEGWTKELSQRVKKEKPKTEGALFFQWCTYITLFSKIHFLKEWLIQAFTFQLLLATESYKRAFG